MGRPRKGQEGKWIEPFLAALSETPIVGLAAKAAGISRRTVYDRRMKDEDFAKRYEEAMDDGLDNLEMDLINLGRGAVKGNVAAVIYHLKVKRYEKPGDGNIPSNLTITWKKPGEQ